MPAKKKSNTIKNRTIFTGDNLHVMRGMADESIDLIYLDPPFNSKHDYAAPIGSEAAGAAFKDTWNLSDIDEEWWGEIAESHPSLYKLLGAIRDINGKSMMSYAIYMAVRIIEMHRILKPTGSLYLHCDPTAGHYLKLIMDAVFGKNNFKNDLVWGRSGTANKGSQHAPKKFGASHDMILFYAKDVKKAKFNSPKVETTDLKKKFPKIDKKGERYNTATPLYCAPSMSPRPNLCYKFRGFENKSNSGWRMKKSRMEEEYQKGNIVIENGKIERRSYMKNYAGHNMNDLWTDIPNAAGNERTGYPTQKPLALLERIISSNSDPNDVVFDPFCGCATTCLAAEKLDRKWIGVDISELAAKLIKSRMLSAARAEDGNQETIERFTKGAGEIVHRTDLPRLHAQRDPCIKNKLYGVQEGMCKGCHNHFEIRQMDLDHKIPRAVGGHDSDDNLQLLCASCNRFKGKKTMDELRARLKELKIIS